MENWEEIKSMRFFPSKETNIGDSVEGEIIRIEDGTYGRNWVIKTNDGEVRTSSNKHLCMLLEKTSIGDYVQIVYKGFGTAKKGLSAPKIFEVKKKVNRRVFKNEETDISPFALERQE